MDQKGPIEVTMGCSTGIVLGICIAIGFLIVSVPLACLAPIFVPIFLGGFGIY